MANGVSGSQDSTAGPVPAPGANGGAFALSPTGIQVRPGLWLQDNGSYLNDQGLPASGLAIAAWNSSVQDAGSGAAAPGELPPSITDGTGGSHTTFDFHVKSSIFTNNAQTGLAINSLYGSSSFNKLSYAQSELWAISDAAAKGNIVFTDNVADYCGAGAAACTVEFGAGGQPAPYNGAGRIYLPSSIQNDPILIAGYLAHEGYHLYLDYVDAQYRNPIPGGVGTLASLTTRPDSAEEEANAVLSQTAFMNGLGQNQLSLFRNTSLYTQRLEANNDSKYALEKWTYNQWPVTNFYMNDPNLRLPKHFGFGE